MKQVPIASVSRAKARQKRVEVELIQDLLEQCNGLCEVCRHGPDWRGLAKHEIRFRSRGGDPTDPLNCIMACGICHDHRKYPVTGTPLTTEEQLEIARQRYDDHS